MSAVQQPVAASVGEVLALYTMWGSDPYDEELSQLDHALQTAALALRDGASDSLLVAALLHDVGHLLELSLRDGVGELPTVDRAHESVGARYLTALFGPDVTAPIALHVRAKRYLCSREPRYLAGLSDGSRRSLELQGGPADPDEIAGFEANPRHQDALRLRGWDDGGKVQGLEVPGLDYHVERLERLATHPHPRDTEYP